MVKRKTGLALVLSAMLVITAACSSGGNKESPAAESSGSPAAKATSSASATPDGSADKEDKLDFSKRIAIEYARQYQQTFEEPPLEQNPVKQQIEKDLNIDYKVSVTAGDSDGFAQLLTTRVATGDMPDIAWVRPQEMERFAEQGVLVPLDEMLDKYFPELKASRTEEEWSLSKVNGKIYSVTRTQAIGSIVANYIRKDWLDNLGLQVPTTTDEYLEVMKAFTFKDPDNNGKNDTIGYTAPLINRVTQGMFANAFGLPQIGIQVGGVPDDWIDANGTLHFGPISDEYKQYLMYLNELQKAGVLDPDLPTNTNQTSQAKIIQGMAGAFSIPNPHNWMFESNPKLLKPILEANPKAEWVLMDPIKGPGGSGHNTISVSAPHHLVIFNKKDDERALRAMSLLNYMDNGAGKLGSEMLNFGIKELHTETVDGKLVIKKEFKDMSNNFLKAYSMSMIEPDMEYQNFVFTEKDRAEFQQIIDHYNSGVTMVSQRYGALPFVYDGDKYVEEMGLRFMYGRDSFDKWDDYVKTLKEKYQYNEVMEVRKQELQKIGLLK